MAIKKSVLYSSLWASCDELRGSMDASQYKDYVLILLFVKYVTDKYKADPRSLIFVPEDGSFDAMVKAKGTKDIGDRINKIIGKLAEENDLKGVIDVADFNDDTKLGKGKDMVDRLTNLIAIFENPQLDFSRNKAGGDDLLGDAYEYLMKHFATESGKSKGQFYTPSEVSRVIARVIGVSNAKSKDTTLYDPTCGSGSLLLKAVDQSPVGLTIYGQEKDNATVALAKMNMILHDQPTADIHQDNTISTPFFKNNDGTLKTFDYVVANPPFSTKSWSNGIDPLDDKYKRFELGIPPAKNGDYAFFLHILKSLKSTGTGAVILPHGVLFRGNAEADIRRNIIKRGYIKGIIGLPSNLFFGTGIPACIIVIDKEQASSRKGIFMINASKGFVKDSNKNRLRQQDIQKIVETFNNLLEIEHYSRMVPVSEIEENDYNLNLPRYISSGDKEDVQDIEAHLRGGIPNADIDEFSEYWELFAELRDKLFVQDTKDGYSKSKYKAEEISEVISNHEEFKDYRTATKSVVDSWVLHTKGVLNNLESGFNPKEVIVELSDDLLNKVSGVKLIDKYDIYQILMTYWAEIFQDDLYIITQDGWKVDIRDVLYESGKNKGKPKKGEWTSDLLPKEIAISEYFKNEQTEIKELDNKIEELNSRMDELVEEHSGDEGVMEEVKSDAGNVTLKNVKEWLKEFEEDPNLTEEIGIINRYLEIDKEMKTLKKELKSREKELDDTLLSKYKELTEEEIKHLVIDNKWIKTIKGRIMEEVDRIPTKLSNRIKELITRYTDTLPEIEEEVKEFEEKVSLHLEKMGFKYE
jgi:type I restriction enzyme M protein